MLLHSLSQAISRLIPLQFSTFCLPPFLYVGMAILFFIKIKLATTCNKKEQQQDAKKNAQL